MEKITQRIGVAYHRRSFVATVGIALLVGAGAIYGSVSRAQTTSGAAQPPPPASTSGTPLPAVQTPAKAGAATTTGSPAQTGAATAPAQGGAPTGGPGAGGNNLRGGGFGGFVQRNRNRGGDRAAGGMISLDLHGADITNLLRIFANAYQMPVVADPTVTGPVTIIAPKQVPLDDAFKILCPAAGPASGSAARCTAQIHDGVISVVTMVAGVSTGSKVNATVDPALMDPKNQIITQVIPLENVDADEIAKSLLPLITKGASLVASSGSNAIVVTDLSSNVQRVIDLVAALDKTSTRSEMAIYNLHHAEAEPIAELINNLYGRITTRGKANPTQTLWPA